MMLALSAKRWFNVVGCYLALLRKRGEMNTPVVDYRTTAAEGLRLYYAGHPEQALPLLHTASVVDDHALLCLGWIQVGEGMRTSSSHLLKRGIKNVKLALKRWAYIPTLETWGSYWRYQVVQRTDQEYWEEQLKRLGEYDPYGSVNELRQFVKSNAPWLDSTVWVS
jgi:hypothetical protein